MLQPLNQAIEKFKTLVKFLGFWGQESAQLWISATINISRSDIAHNRFAGTSWDPQFQLSGLPGLGLFSGSAFFDVKIALHSGELSKSFLYFDRGAGFSEATKIELIPLDGNRLGAFIDDLRGIRRLRWDPGEGPIDISVLSIRLRRAKPQEAALAPSLKTARLFGLQILPNVTLKGVSLVSTHCVSVTDQACVFSMGKDASIVVQLECNDGGVEGLWTIKFQAEGIGLSLRSPRIFFTRSDGSFEQSASFILSREADGSYAAILALSSASPVVRWDPSDYPGLIRLTEICAVPFSFTEKIATDPSSDVDVSRLLTAHIYGDDVIASDYETWIVKNEPSPLDAQRLWGAALKRLKAKPLISILAPTFETPAPLLEEMIESVIAQIYPHWELCIADDASKSPHVREIIEGYMANEPRIKAVFRARNGHISEASNSALQLVTANWLALLDHDDLLTPDALLAVAGEIEAYPDAEFIYSDEDKLDVDANRYEPFFKPDYSPELLRSQNYLNHLSVHKTANVRAVGGWRKGYEGSQDYDLNLRTLEKIDPKHVRHIPKVLYHWRAVEGSTALSTDQKTYAFTAGLKALEDHLHRGKWSATVEATPNLPFYRVRYAIPSPAPMVSVIIPTRDRADLLRVCVDSILQQTDYQPYELIIVNNGSEEPATFALFKDLERDARVRILDHPGPFNYSKINNVAVRESRGDIICLLNNDIEVISPDWMREMASWAIQPRIGCVGAKLYYPNDTIQHAGVTLGLGGVAGHPHKHRGRNDPGYFGRLMVSHDVSAVTGACLFVRKEVYNAMGGLDERLQVAFNDVDFCIRVRQAGYHNVFTPFAELYHHESVSRGEDEAPEKRARFIAEIEYMHQRWDQTLLADPFYSPNLSYVKDDYSLA